MYSSQLQPGILPLPSALCCFSHTTPCASLWLLGIHWLCNLSQPVTGPRGQCNHGMLRQEAIILPRGCTVCSSVSSSVPCSAAATPTYSNPPVLKRKAALQFLKLETLTALQCSLIHYICRRKAVQSAQQQAALMAAQPLNSPSKPAEDCKSASARGQ